ncbi:MAG: arginase family protein [Planctomycetota bacterium]|jgi:arginase family enzyme
MSDPQARATRDAPPNFLGLEPEHSGPGARVWVLPVPYEATTTYGKGTARGPRAIIAASQEVELYDRERRSRQQPARRLRWWIVSRARWRMS